MSPSISPSTWQIPVDFTISKGHLGLIRGELTVYDAYGNKAYKVSGRSSSRRMKTLFDVNGDPLISAVHQDGKWQGFKGNSRKSEDLVFTVKKIFDSQFKTELEVFLTDSDSGDQRPSFRLKGSPFWRSCTIYSGNSIVAQTNLLYKLGKVIYSRHKFHLTVYPGIDHSIVIAMLITFFG